ncbi:MAG: glycosyltransferase family 2 protein, partial [Flavobacteriaceae bacterium]|nr:glycosyltransferase family 2 protein [Flavobacteriaceae bacterium]
FSILELKKYLNDNNIQLDFIILNDLIGMLDDCEDFLNEIYEICTINTRLIISHYSQSWRPILFLAGLMRLKMKPFEQNWLTNNASKNFLTLSNFEVLNSDLKILLPFNIPFLSNFVNKFIVHIPIIRKLSLRQYIVARKSQIVSNIDLSVSIIVPCKNEKGNINDAIERLPEFGCSQEIIFIEGGSSDGTYEQCIDVRDKYHDKNIVVEKQQGNGKWNAVKTGFDIAQGDVLIILDADLTVPPEMLPRFYEKIANNSAEFVNGTRLVYSIDKGAMQTLNFFANHIFAKIFSYILGQKISDTLCGTKVIKKSDYLRAIKKVEEINFNDPFGDFTLIFGASMLDLKMIDVPIRYKRREYGETQISRFKHGIYLLKISIQGLLKIKFI